MSATVTHATAALIGGNQESHSPPCGSRNEIAACKRDRARNADARRMPGRGTRHHPGVDAIGKQLETGHVGAGPAHARKRACGKSRPEAVGKQRKHRVADHGCGHAKEIDALGIDAVRQSDEHRHRQHIGAVEACGDPAGFTVGKLPKRHQARQQSRPEEGADLHEHLRAAHDRDEAFPLNLHRLPRTLRRRLAQALFPTRGNQFKAPEGGA